MLQDLAMISVNVKECTGLDPKFITFAVHGHTAITSV